MSTFGAATCYPHPPLSAACVATAAATCDGTFFLSAITLFTLPVRDLFLGFFPFLKVEETVEGSAAVKQVFEIKRKGEGKVAVAGCEVAQVRDPLDLMRAARWPR